MFWWMALTCSRRPRGCGWGTTILFEKVPDRYQAISVFSNSCMWWGGEYWRYCTCLLCRLMRRTWICSFSVFTYVFLIGLVDRVIKDAIELTTENSIFPEYAAMAVSVTGLCAVPLHFRRSDLAWTGGSIFAAKSVSWSVLNESILPFNLFLDAFFSYTTF